MRWGLTPVEGVVVEDRGNRGPQGCRFYRVRVQLDDNITEPMETERPADDLTLVARGPTQTRKRRRGKRADNDRDGGPAGTEPGAP